IGVSDLAGRIAPQDEITLCLEEAPGAFGALLQFPVAVREFFGLLFKTLDIGLQFLLALPQPDGGASGQNGRAGSKREGEGERHGPNATRACLPRLHSGEGILRIPSWLQTR